METTEMTTTNTDLSQDRTFIERIRPWAVIVSASLFLFYIFIQINMFNAISPYLIGAFYLTSTQVGKLSAYFFYANVIFLIPAGIILDRLSTRYLILIFQILAILGTFVFALSHTLWLTAAARFVVGISSAFCFLAPIRLASRWLPSRRLGIATGVVVTMGMLGGMVAQTPLTVLAEQFGWRHAVIFDALFGVIILFIIILLVRDYPANYREKHTEERAKLKQLGYLRSMQISYSRLQNWLCGVYASLINLPIFLLGGLWGILYLSVVRRISQNTASLIISMLFLGTIIGSPLVGSISDRLQLRKLPMIVGAIFSLFIVLLIMFLPYIPLAAFFILFFALGFVISSQVISYPVVTESNSKLVTSTATSIVSICLIGGGAIFQPFFGWIMDTMWDGKLLRGLPVYSAMDYQFAMGIFPAVFIISLIISFFIKETHGKRGDNQGA